MPNRDNDKPKCLTVMDSSLLHGPGFHMDMGQTAGRSTSQGRSNGFKTCHFAIILVNLDAETPVPVCAVTRHLRSQSTSLPPVKSLMKRKWPLT